MPNYYSPTMLRNIIFIPWLMIVCLLHCNYQNKKLTHCYLSNDLHAKMHFGTCNSCFVSFNLNLTRSLINMWQLNHKTFILLHGTQALLKIDCSMRLRYSYLTLAFLTSSSTGFNTETQLGFGKNSAINFLLFGTYGTTTNQMLRHYVKASFDVNAWTPMVADANI